MLLQLHHFNILSRQGHLSLLTTYPDAVINFQTLTLKRLK